MRIDNNSICPVFGLEKYITVASKMGVHLKLGYLFRILHRSRKCILEIPASYSVMYGRLKSYLRQLGIDEGEKPHNIRGGCAVILTVSDFGNTNDIMDHICWFSKNSFDW